MRRLNVHLISQVDSPEATTEWINGYQKAIHDAEVFLEQLDVYEPYME